MRRIALTALLVLGAVGLAATPAQAHNYVVSTNPAENTTISELPSSFEVTTNGPLLVLDGATGGFALQVLGPDGLYYGDGCLAVEGATLSMPATIGDAGDYAVLWQLVSEDGHSVSGEFAFTWAPDATAEPSPGSAEPPVCGAEPPAPSTTPTEPGATVSATFVPTPTDSSLSNVLWIGGAVVAVLVASLVTLLVATRKRKPRAE